MSGRHIPLQPKSWGPLCRASWFEHLKAEKPAGGHVSRGGGRRKIGRARPLPAPPLSPPGFPPGPHGNGTSASGLRPTAASGRSFGPRGPPSARHFLPRRLWRSPAPAAAVLRAARCQHGRPRAGAGVHDPRSAGAGQVGPRVVASLATPRLRSRRRGLPAAVGGSAVACRVTGWRPLRARGLARASFRFA